VFDGDVARSDNNKSQLVLYTGPYCKNVNGFFSLYVGEWRYSNYHDEKSDYGINSAFWRYNLVFLYYLFVNAVA